MKTFKQFLLLQETSLHPPPPEGFEYVSPPQRKRKSEEPIQQTEPVEPKKADGMYTTTAREALTRRIGTPEETNKYIEDIRQRRKTHPLQSSWILPSLEDEHLDRPMYVKVGELTDPAHSKTSGYYTPQGQQEGDIITDSGGWATKDNPININSNEFISKTFPYSENLKQISSELTTGKIPKVDRPFSDTLWHEMQHVLQNPTHLGRNTSQLDSNAGFLLEPKSDDPMTQKSQRYVTSPVEMAAHASAAKSQFRQQTGINLGANMSQEEFTKFKDFIKSLEQSSSMKTFYDILTNPKTAKDAEELLRQVVQKTKSSDFGYA